jgi:hypothetical protein
MLARSRLKIADFYYLKRSRYQAARVFYNEAITIAPNSESAQQARERIAQLEVDEARYEASILAQAEKPRRGFLGFLGGGGPAIAPVVTSPATGGETTGAPSEGERASSVTPSP